MPIQTILTRAQRDRQEADKKEARRAKVEDRPAEEIVRVEAKLLTLLAMPQRRDLVTALCWLLSDDETEVNFYTGLDFKHLYRYLSRDLVLYITWQGLMRWDYAQDKHPYEGKEVPLADYPEVIRRRQISEGRLDRLIADIQA